MDMSFLREISGALPKGQPRVLEKHAKDVARAASLRDAYAVVDTRDHKVCQVRGTPLVADHANAWKALERHHMAGRLGDNLHETDTILTCSRAVHQLFESGALWPVNAAGEKVERVSEIAGYRWNDHMVEQSKRPFRLRARKEWRG